MKKSIFLVAMLFSVLLRAADLFIEAEKPFYQIGEKITFKVTGAEPGEKITYTIDTGAGTSRPQELSGDTIRCTLDHPGFAFVEISTIRNGKKMKIPAGAGVEVEKIRTATPRPSDFDQFWDDAVATQRKEKLEIVFCKEIPSPRARVKTFDVRLKRGDLELTGYLAMPESASKEHPMPGLAGFQGASAVNVELKNAAGLAVTGWVSFETNFHAMPNLPAITAAEKNARRKSVARYHLTNAGDREKYAMRNIFLRTVLAVDFLASLPEVAHDAIVVGGGSLGGCQALVAAALAPETVRYCIATVPAMSDHFGRKHGCTPGWPKLLDSIPSAQSGAPYFDTVNFASRIKCPVVTSCGFVDVAVSPASVYAMYAELKCEKKIIPVQFAGHGASLKKGTPNAIGAGTSDRHAWMSKWKKEHLQ